MSPPAERFWVAARRPRMVGLLLLLVLLAGICGRLGVWQIHRAVERSQLAEQQARVEAAAKAPEGLGILLAPQKALNGSLIGRQAWVEGAYEPGGQLLVAGREVGGKKGYLVLTPLRVTDDGTGGRSWATLSGAPVIAVVRGWVADPHDAAALAVPSGTVRVTGYLQASESTGPGGLPTGQTDSIATGSLVNLWGGPIYSGYLVLQAADPPQASGAGALVLAPRPTIEGSEGVNMQNAFYALQWFVFGGFALALWVRSVRDEAAGGRRRGGDGGIAGLPAPEPDESGDAARVPERI